MERAKFSKFGAIAVIAGSAVGLGNIWRFPYMVATNGGAAFILLYILFVVLICLPVMIAELTIGRKYKKDAYGAVVCTLNERKLPVVGKILGCLYVILPLLVISYYCVIGGSTIDYFMRSLGIHIPENTGTFIMWAIIFLAMCAAIVFTGVKKGIEKFSKLMMPVLFVIVVLIAVRSMTMPANPGTEYTSADGMAFLFKPDFSKITVKTCIAALGQAFFSLSLGCGVLVNYGSYINPEHSLTKTAAQIALSDLIFAIIAGCAVIPAVFALKADPMAILADNSDSKLVFNILPDVFPSMPMGSCINALFFFALILAAITSAISQFEVPVGFLNEEKGLSRRKSVIIIFLISAILNTLCAVRGNILNAIDGLCANWLMPLGGILATVLAAWVLSKKDFFDEISSNGSVKVSVKSVNALNFLIRYIAPAGILVVFLSQIIK